MSKKKEEIETKEAPVKDPVSERKRLKEEVEKSVKEKIEAILQDFHNQQDQGIEELERLQGQVEELEGKKAALLTERRDLAKGIFGIGGKGVGDIDGKISWLEKNIRGLQKQINEKLSKLTEIPKFDFSFLNFLSLHEKSKP
jgi:chromosome segregation ATPase